MTDLNEHEPPLLVRAATENDLARVRQLLAEGVDVDAKDKFGYTALHKACCFGYLEIVQLLVDRGACVNLQKKTWGDTPLHFACLRGHLEVARWLLEHGANVTAEDSILKRTPLYMACGNGHLEIVRMLLDQYDRGIELNRNGGVEYLEAASRGGNLDLVKLLVELGVQVNATKDSRTATSLHGACEYRGSLEMVRFLLSKGADVHAKDHRGKTPLACACFTGDLEIVKLLIASGAEIDSRDDFGETPLFLACAWKPEVIAIPIMLIQHGADVNPRSKIWDNKTPLHFACGKQDGNVKIIQLLMESGADIRAKDKNGMIPFHIACKEGQLEWIQLLIENGAEDLNAKDNTGKTPLHLACECGRLEVVKLLLTFDNDVPMQVNAQDNDGKTPFYLACENGHLKLMHFLLSRGANLHVKMTQWLTALEIASEKSHLAIVWCLVRQYPSLY